MLLFKYQSKYKWCHGSGGRYFKRHNTFDNGRKGRNLIGREGSGEHSNVILVVVGTNAREGAIMVFEMLWPPVLVVMLCE